MREISTARGIQADYNRSTGSPSWWSRTDISYDDYRASQRHLSGADYIEAHNIVCKDCGEVKEVISATLFRTKQCMACWCDEQNRRLNPGRSK